MEGARSVDDGLKRGIRDYSLLEGIWLSDILHDCKIQPVLPIFRFCLPDLVSFRLRAYRGDYGVPMFEEDIEDVGGDEAAAACTALAHMHIGFVGPRQWVLEGSEPVRRTRVMVEDVAKTSRVLSDWSV